MYQALKNLNETKEENKKLPKRNRILNESGSYEKEGNLGNRVEPLRWGWARLLTGDVTPATTDQLRNKNLKGKKKFKQKGKELQMMRTKCKTLRNKNQRTDVSALLHTQ